MKTNVLFTLLLSIIFSFSLANVSVDDYGLKGSGNSFQFISGSDSKEHADRYTVRLTSDSIPRTVAAFGITAGTFSLFGAQTANPANYSEATVLRYDNSTNVNAIGMTGGGAFTAAVRFPASTMGQYAGMALSQVDIFIYHVPVSAVLKVWGAGADLSPGALLYQKQLAPEPLSWMEIDIPLQIGITGEDIWVGIEVSHAAGLGPVGVGPGPAVVGFGDLISVDGIAFVSLLNATGLNFNWNIAATLSAVNVPPTAFAGEDATICATEQYIPENATATDFSSVLWTTSGDGYFITPVSLNPTYVPGPGDISSGLVTLCIAAFPVGSGQPATDCMVLTIDLDPATCCCPDFKLKDAIEICAPEGACSSEPGLGKHGMAACKETSHTYTVYPNDPGYVYTWTITGGTPATFTGNPITVLWGSGSVGIIEVAITGNNCDDLIIAEICLIDGPQADFTFSPNPVCLNTNVNFVNTSAGGATYFWDFGNGATFSGANPPPQQYSSPGTYVITLTAQDTGDGSAQGDRPACGCVDTISKTIVVLEGEGPKIETDCCYGTVCPGGTSSFYTNLICTTYNWTVAGGTITSGAGTNAITVQWAATYPGFPSSVTLSVPGCGSAPCPGSTTIFVPVLYPNLPISGPSTLCVGSSGTFSLPVLPGTYYTWTVTGGAYQFNEKDRNVPNVNITFSTPGTYTIKCEYDNPMAGCDGESTFTVNVLPVFSIVAGPEKVCEGSSEMYFSNANANWYVYPPGNLVATGNSPAISWSTPGFFTLVAKPVNPALFCNDSAVKIVEVIAKPVLGPITGKTMVCPDKNQTYSVTSNTSGSDFVWTITSGTGIIQSEMGADKDSVIVKWTGTGSWTLKVEQQIEISPGNFCTSLPQFINVTPFPTPAITGVQTVCADAVETYVASGPTPPGGFQWSVIPPGQGTIISGQGTNTVNIKWHGPMNNSVSLKVEHCSGLFILPITVNAPPSAVASYSTLPVFCEGDNTILTLSIPPCAGCTYQWYKAPGTLLGTGSGQNINISTLSLGVHEYYAIVTLNGCSMKSNIIKVIIKDCDQGGGGPCDVIAQFWSYVECDKVTLIDKSVAAPPATITNYQWTVSGPGSGVFSPNANFPSPVLTVSASGTYLITLTVTSSSGCTSTYTELVNILLPTANFTFTSPTCVDDPVSFVPIPNNPNFNYYWDFGDGFDSYTALTEHAYALPSPPPYNVTLTITDQYGCIATAQKQVWINPKTPCVIMPSDTAFCPGGFVTLAACANMSSYQWFKDELPIAGATNSSYVVYQHGEYSVEVTNTFGCKRVADGVYIYMYPTPKAKITGDAYICSSAWSNAFFYLSTPFNPNYSYQWNGPSGNPNDYFSPSTNNDAWGTMPPGTTGQYIFTVTVTDNTTGCTATDYICVTFNLEPDLSVPFYSGCEGPPVTLVPTPNDPVNYTYQWSNGATTPIITVVAAGSYALTMTDKLTGCSTTAFAAMIFPIPDLSLFPIGCGTMMCNDTLDLYIPLPLNALPWPNTITDTYPLIEWYDQSNTLVGTGDVLPFVPVTAGSYQFSVVVQNYFGCVDTAGVFCLEVECCLVEIESIETIPASCPEICDGSITILLDPASTGGPFTITQTSPPPTAIWTIVPGVPLVLTGLCPDFYTFVIMDEMENCVEEITVQLGFENDICCNIIIEYTDFTNASCPETCDGSLTIVLDPASTVAPFTISQIAPPGPSWTIIPGIPFTLTGLCPGIIGFVIEDESGLCFEEVFFQIGFESELCCFAAVDPSFIHITSNLLITSNTVWDNKYFIADGIMVTVDNGAMLDITNVDVVFGECAGIEFINGGYLRANNSVFRPCEMDKTWKGLRFDDGLLTSSVANMVNECTFKNAEVALYFLKDADALISNNLFSNCNYGIRVEGNTKFNHPISGNRFVTETFYPDYKIPCVYPFINTQSSYGIYSTNSDFLQTVSHNEFVNTHFDGNVINYGIYQIFGSGKFSNNTFTDVNFGIFVRSQLAYTGILANVIESKVKGFPVWVEQSSGPVVEIHQNTLINAYHQLVITAGIYVNISSRLSISGNNISGFYYGILATSVKNSEITNNILDQCFNTGIYFSETGTSSSYITCNEITMQNFNSTTGIYGVNMSATSEVTSNCVNDCRVSMDFRSFNINPVPLPRIRNNFLYNYNIAGINVQGHVGNIGVALTDPGLNTLWSNRNSAIDINKSAAPPITVADNFGMFNFSFPNVQIVSNRPYHSTASCAQQIFNMPSQGNLNINFTCDNYSKLIKMMTGNSGSYQLTQDYLNQLKSSASPYLDVNTIFASVGALDEAMLENMIATIELTANEKALLRYEFHHRNGDVSGAKAHLQNFIPQDNLQAETKMLLMLNLDITENGWEALSADLTAMLMAVAESESVNANLAIYMLNNTGSYVDYISEAPQVEDILLGDQIVRLDNVNSYLNMFPNPATNNVFVEAFNASSAQSKIEIFDMSGRLVSDYILNFVAGGIELDIRKLTQGFYFVTLSDVKSGIVQKGKLVKVSN